MVLERLISRLTGGRSGAMSDMLAIGAEAPDFTLACDTGEEIRLADHRGKENVVLVFYPKNNTPG